MREIAPPIHISLPTNSLLEPRLESARKRDRRSFSHPEGSFRRMQRMDWDNEDDLQPIYASLDDIVERIRLLESDCVISIAGRGGLRASATEGIDPGVVYRIWHAVLRSLGAVASQIIDRYPNAFAPEPCGVNLTLQRGVPFSGKIADAQTPALAQTLTTTSGGELPTIEVSMDWFRHLWIPDNDAEVELVATILESSSNRHGSC